MNFDKECGLDLCVSALNIQQGNASIMRVTSEGFQIVSFFIFIPLNKTKQHCFILIFPIILLSEIILFHVIYREKQTTPFKHNLFFIIYNISGQLAISCFSNPISDRQLNRQCQLWEKIQPIGKSKLVRNNLSQSTWHGLSKFCLALVGKKTPNWSKP